MNFSKLLFRCNRNKIITLRVINFGKHLDRYKVISPKNFDVMFYSGTAMEDIYDPPKSIRGMKVLDRNVIRKTITISCLIVSGASIDYVIRIAKNYMLKMKGIKSVQALEGTKQRILIDVKKINTWNDLDENTLENLKKLDVTEDNFCKVPLELSYENWLHYEILKAILPEGEPPLTSFSIIGHIVHLNIKDHLLDYKNIIADVLLDKIPTAKTVVYKKAKIDNTYRNFEMEVLCGEPNFIASVKENQCNYELDFSKVYWNPRLSTEHMRIVDILKEGDILFDVFAGVGPFAIPAAKKKCLVFANDLNPESVKWLEHNIALNKKARGYIKTFNKDGGDFLLNDVKENLVKTYQDEHFNGKIYLVMNLPAIAPTFLKILKGLMTEIDFAESNIAQIKKCLPVVHCYFFSLQTESVKYKFEEYSGISLDDVEHNFYFIRKVSNSKSMHRITFTLPFNYLMAGNAFDESCEPFNKRIRSN